jgi:hypothetical protein
LRVHKIPQLDPILRQIIAVYVIPAHFFKVNLRIVIRLRLGLPNSPFLSGFPTKILYAFLLSLVLATCLINVMPFVQIIRMVFGEEYRSHIFFLSLFVQSPITSTFLSQNFFLNSTFSNILTLCYSLNLKGQVSHSCKTAERNVNFYILNPVYL